MTPCVFVNLLFSARAPGDQRGHPVQLCSKQLTAQYNIKYLPNRFTVRSEYFIFVNTPRSAAEYEQTTKHKH